MHRAADRYYLAQSQQHRQRGAKKSREKARRAARNGGEHC